jgi:hypothetical protein
MPDDSLMIAASKRPAGYADDDECDSATAKPAPLATAKPEHGSAHGQFLKHAPTKGSKFPLSSTCA